MPITINGSTGISGNDGSASTPTLQGTDTNTGVFFPAADTIAFAEGGAEVGRFDSNGNLLVNTTTNTNNSRVAVNGTVESTSGGFRFPDGTTQTTAAGALTTTAVLNATAGASVGAVGSYAFLGDTAVFTINPGDTRAGSNLRYAGITSQALWSTSIGALGSARGTTTTPAGTWRAMGKGAVPGDGEIGATIWLRIS